MRYEWDEDKDARNRAKHGLSFDAIYDAEWDQACVLIDDRRDYGEERRLAYLPMNGRLYAVIYVMRGEVRRIISLRKANVREVAYYDRQDI
jgi:uncharacterized DUF497 family protein